MTTPSQTSARARKNRSAALALLPIALGAAAGAWGQDSSSGSALIDEWLSTSDAAKESQPHWMTPVITVTPRLEQEFRYDQSWQSRPNGVDLDAYGAGKGLELIPLPNTEVIIGVPAYQTRSTPTLHIEGWADETLLLKYRLASQNEEHGNYIVTAFLGISVPTGNAVFTSHHPAYTPTIAAGKGWGDRNAGFDIQSTLAITIPDDARHTLGTPIVWNTALQAHLLGKLWPELELNYSHFKEGPNNGKDQWALAEGLILGRFQLTSRMRLIIGGAFQEALSSFRTLEHTWLLTARATF